MSDVFVDTSAIYAFLVPSDRYHLSACNTFKELEREKSNLVTSSFVLCEVVALLQARVGSQAVRKFETGVMPLLRVTWVDAPLYARAMAALLAAGNRLISLTDWSSFELIRHLGLKTAFTFDEHFSQQGFSLRPADQN